MFGKSKVSNNFSAEVGSKVVSVIPKQRERLLKWNGWGYKDSGFEAVNGTLIFTSDRYPIGESLPLPYFTQYVRERMNADLNKKLEPKPLPTRFPDPVQCPEFLTSLTRLGIDFTQRGEDRLIRSHCQSISQIYALQTGSIDRLPDVVLFPTGHDQVVQVVQTAQRCNVVVIPYGGGTSVSGASDCPENETRPIAVLDTTQMNRMLWIDEENLIACFEAGIVGQDLERELRKYGCTSGHEPDSYEFSTLGGWVATRASGMKKNRYGNIEDIVVRMKMVTVRGVLERVALVPRVSCGPDFDHVILGSEGTLGVVTEVVIKLRPLPEVKKYGSLVFPDFATGIRCLREVAKERLQPASIRLIDNEQFVFGQTLKPKAGVVGGLVSALQKSYLSVVKGMDLKKIAAATLVFEGRKDDVKRHEDKIFAIAKKHGGFSAGGSNGEKGYVLTYVVAYLRDLCLSHHMLAESFETSISWNRCESLCTNVRNRIDKECASRGIRHHLISCRVTQSYDVGACVYFYFGFNFGELELDDPVSLYDQIEEGAREEILASGGSISHHHGIGKKRARWYRAGVSPVGERLYRAAKRELDPKNIFAAGNFLFDHGGDDDGRASDEHQLDGGDEKLISKL